MPLRDPSHPSVRSQLPGEAHPQTPAVIMFPEEPQELTAFAAGVCSRVWRTTLEEPGFAIIAFKSAVSSLELRRAMVRLFEAMPVPFVPERAGRFDQQVTSRFHRDGAPPASLLLLGYEPTTVRSRLFVADPHSAAAQAGLGVVDFLAVHNPMFPAGEARLWPFVTEVVLPPGEPCIVAINNSLVPDTAPGPHPLGLLHKAEVPTPDLTASRVINSLGLMLAGDPDGTPLAPGAIQQFLTRAHLD